VRRALVAEVVAWWTFFVGLWCALVGNLSSVELGCGAAAGLIAAAGIGQLRWLRWPASLPKWRWVSWLPVVVAAAVADTVRLAVVLVRWVVRHRRDLGGFTTVPLGPPGRTRGAHRHRAYAVLTLSATPGSFVVATYPEHGQARIHTLGDGRPSLADKVGR